MSIYEISNIEEVKKHIVNEKDYYEFEYQGYTCIIKRIQGLGHLCGYIKSASGRVRAAAEDNFHGGVTYDEDGVIGFDCAHHMDIAGHDLYMGESSFGGTYKTMHYVERNLKETIDLAEGV